MVTISLHVSVCAISLHSKPNIQTVAFSGNTSGRRCSSVASNCALVNIGYSNSQFPIFNFSSVIRRGLNKFSCSCWCSCPPVLSWSFLVPVFFYIIRPLLMDIIVYMSLYWFMRGVSIVDLLPKPRSSWKGITGACRCKKPWPICLLLASDRRRISLDASRNPRRRRCHTKSQNFYRRSH